MTGVVLILSTAISSRIPRRTLVEPEDLCLVKRFEVRGVNLTQSVRFPRGPDPQRLPLVSDRKQQRQCEVVPQNAAGIIHTM